jgi:hypothetical protein
LGNIKRFFFFLTGVENNVKKKKRVLLGYFFLVDFSFFIFNHPIQIQNKNFQQEIYYF